MTALDLIYGGWRSRFVRFPLSPTPQPGFIQVPRTRSPSHLYAGQPVCQIILWQIPIGPNQGREVNKELIGDLTLCLFRRKLKLDPPSMRKMTDIIPLMV